MCRYFYVWFLPLIWTSIAALNFRYPGDEYGMFAVGSAAGIWILWLFPQLHMGRSPLGILPVVLLAGAASMALLGLALDRLRCWRSVWLALIWLATAGALADFGISRFESLDRAISKNGSLLAYVLPAINISLTLLSLGALFILAIWRSWKWWRTRA